MEFESNTNVTFGYDDENSYEKSIFGGKPMWAEIGYFLVPILGIPGNILTIFVLFSNVTLRNKPINMFIMHQSVIDLIVCFLTILEELVIEFNINGQVICHLLRTKQASQMTMYASSYNMTALTLERHFAIINPLHYDIEKVRKRLPYVFVGVWVFCIAALSIIPISTVYDNSICYTSIRIKGNYLD